LSSEKTKRGDTGKYELTLRNAKGEVKVPIDVTVLGKRLNVDDNNNEILLFKIVLVNLKVQ
jgi:hypothetical protein